MQRKSKLDKNTSKRWKKLGELGERIAEIILAENGFTNIQNLNSLKQNHKFADIIAERFGGKFVITVKARNKYQTDGDLNSRYKLGEQQQPQMYANIKVVEGLYNATAAFLAISLDIDEHTFDAYYSLISKLNGNRGIPMTDSAKRNYETLAENKLLASININPDEYTELKNKYDHL